MVVTKPEENGNEEGIADKPTEGIDIFTIVMYLRSQEFFDVPLKKGFHVGTVSNMYLKNLLSKPGMCVVYAKLLLIVKLISIKPSFITKSYGQSSINLK